MNILIAPDKFKGTLSSMDVIQSLQGGLNRNHGAHNIKFVEMADGGEGSAAIVARRFGAIKKEVSTCDALGRPVVGEYFHDDKSKMVLMDMATASGLFRVLHETEHFMKMNTRGVGRIINQLNAEVGELVIGLGGSATNDLAMGMAMEMGVEFLDDKKNRLDPIPLNMQKVDKINCSGIPEKIASLRVRCLCDVENPVTGPNGAVYTFARQKGATDTDLNILEAGMQNMVKVIQKDLRLDLSKVKRGGSAGGFGAGAMAFLGAELISGFDYIAEITELENKIQWADLIITGEGKIDSTSFQGKVVGGIHKLSEKYNKKLMVICGQSDIKDKQIDVYDLSARFGIQRAMNNPADLLKIVGSELLD